MVRSDYEHTGFDSSYTKFNYYIIIKEINSEKTWLLTWLQLRKQCPTGNGATPWFNDSVPTVLSWLGLSRYMTVWWETKPNKSVLTVMSLALSSSLHSWQFDHTFRKCAEQCWSGFVIIIVCKPCLWCQLYTNF